MRTGKSKNWFFRNLHEIRMTIFPEDVNDSRFKKAGKNVGWLMFLMLLLCATAGVITAASFAH